MSFDAFIDEIWQNHQTRTTATNRVQKQFSQIFNELGHTPKNAINLGYRNSAGFALQADEFYEADNNKKYDTVLALDEYFTYASDEETQKQLVNSAIKMLKPGGMLLTSMRDYRNNPVHKRNLGDSSYININNTHHIIVEVNSPNSADSQVWKQTNFVIKNDDAATAYELGNRRTIYFKQLAKYCNDANSKQFGVLRENFWRSPWKRSTEHIAWAKF